MRAVIRPAAVPDAEACLDIYAPIVRDTAWSFELVPPTLAEFRARIAEYRRFAPWLVCELDGGCAGYAYAVPFRARPAYQWSIEVSVYIHAQFRRRRVGRGLYTTLLELLRLQNFVTAVAVIALPNPASTAMHEALGFRPVGVFPHVGFKMNAWRDTGWWIRPLREPPVMPLPLLTPDQVLASPAGQSALQTGMDAIPHG